MQHWKLQDWNLTDEVTGVENTGLENDGRIRRGRICVHLVTRGHFRSRDKDGGHTTRSVILENPSARKRHGSVFYTTRVIADGSFTSRE